MDTVDVMFMIPTATNNAVEVVNTKGRLLLHVTDNALLRSVHTSADKAMEEGKDKRGMLKYLTRVVTSPVGIGATAWTATNAWVAWQLIKFLNQKPENMTHILYTPFI